MRLITHSYDSYDHAVQAVHALEAAGVPHDDISLVSGDQDRNVSTTVAGDTADSAATGAGTGASVGTLLGGGAGLLAGIGSLAIPGVGPIVAAGWLIATLTGAGVGAAAGGLLGSLTGAGVSDEDAKTYADHVERGGTLLSVRATDDMATDVEYILEHGQARASTAASPALATSAATVAPIPAVAAAPARTAATGTTTGTGETIELVKEDLVVGKREVDQGGVRVTTKVVETPVEEQVNLRDERVVVDRRPINRPLTGTAADAFRERTLSATATGEEAVVGKTARVVEEVALRKDVQDRVETVRDSVRETKVDVEHVAAEPNGATATTRSGNTASRAIDRELGTNISGANPKI